MFITLLATVIVGTWNGNWFPSGRAEHRAHPDVERATITATARMLADGIRTVDPAGTNDVILCLNEIRGPLVASNLVAQIGRPGLRVAVVTGYRRRDRFDQQQDVIATTLPIAETHWSRWRALNRTMPPRGYAFAAVVIDPATTAHVYAVHLKSNYGTRSKPDVAAANREKRTVAMQQLIEQERPQRRGRGMPTWPVIIAGDMNADKWKPEFREERLFDILEEAGFANPLGDLPPEARGTHPSEHYGDSALDYVFCRGFDALSPARVVPNDGLSDHRAVFFFLGVAGNAVSSR